jgi:uncharacterized protein
MTFTSNNLEIYPAIFPFLGFIVGNFSGLLGLGGGWLLTPALNIMGFPAATSVGTSLAQMVGSTGVGAFKHWRLGNLMPKFALMFIAPLVIGVFFGKYLMNFLIANNLEESAIRYLHMTLGASLAIIILKEAISKSKNFNDVKENLQLITIPQFGPSLKVNSDIQIPFYAIFAIALVAGLASSIMGIGGGLILIPTMIYVFGIPTITAVATNLACIFVGSTVGATNFFLQGQVEPLAALLILSGSMTGSYVGATLSQYINKKKLRLIFGLLIVTSTTSIFLKQINLSQAAQFVIFGGALSLWSLAVIPGFYNWYRSRNSKEDLSNV